MHNKDQVFQYFSVDFNNKDFVALHASGLITEAVYTRHALQKIQALYSANNGEIANITIIAHSLGGVVARLALILQDGNTIFFIKTSQN